jgi:aminotransferase
MRAVAEKLHLSEIAPGMVQSEIRAMTVACDLCGGVNLAQGVCDTEVPAPVAARAVEAIAQGLNIYTRMDGIEILRKVIADKLARHNSMKADPDGEILVTSGATAGFQAACMALFDPGDEVVLFEPFYGYHLNTLRSARQRDIGATD